MLTEFRLKQTKDYIDTVTSMMTMDVFVGVGDTLSIKLRVGDKFQMLIGDL